MGVLVSVVFGHLLLKKNIIDLDKKLCSSTNSTWMYKQGRLPEFELEQILSNGPGIRLVGTNGEQLVVMKQTCKLTLNMNWKHVESNIGNISLISKKINKVMGSPYFLYLPDNAYHSSGALDMIYENCSIEDIKKWLLHNCVDPTIRSDGNGEAPLFKGIQFYIDYQTTEGH